MKQLPVINEPVLPLCDQCTQRFGRGEETFRCRWGCTGDFHPECLLLHHEEHDQLMERTP